VSGGWQRFLDYAFLNKGTYLRVAGVSYPEELWEYLALLGLGPGNPLAVVQRQPLVLPILLVPALAIVVVGRQRLRGGAALPIALALAEAASLQPRPDLEHVVPAVPGMLVVMLAAWHVGAWRLTPTWRRSLAAACMLAIAAALAVRLGASATALAGDSRDWSHLPHLRGVLMYREQLAELDARARALRAAAPSGRLFLLLPDASLYYLISGLENPTPFDYPLVTAFGRTGEAEMVDSLAAGRLGQVCMRPIEGSMAPARLQDAVRLHLRPKANLAVCTLYGPRQ
jgi:hypothetical protein